MDAEVMDNTELTIEEQISFLLQDLPAPIQKFVKSSERDEVSLQLTRKYGLHADDAGVFERAYLFMLLGVFTPDEFVQEMRESGIDEATIRALASDVNELVFKKLRKEEREDGVAPAAYRNDPPPSQIPPMQIGERATIPENLPGQAGSLQWTKPPPVSVSPQTPPAVAPLPPEPASQLAPIPIYGGSQAPPNLPYSRTMAGDMERASQNRVVEPPPVPPPPSAPLSETSPAQQPPPPPAWQPPPTAPVRRTPIDQTHAPAVPITREYGNDPYREPVE